MTTGSPAIDLFNEIILALLEQFERAAFPDGGLEDCEGEAGRVYNEELKRPYVCELIADVVSGRWKLGTSQEEISERLGIFADRGWVSRALHQGGPLSLDIYMRLRCCPTRPVDWEPDIDELKADMDRSAFIGVARFFAARITDRPTLSPQRLNELNYELICEMFGSLSTWLPGHVRHDEEMARQIVGRVCSDNRRNVNPSWQVGSKRRQIEAEMKRLTSDQVAAFDHLSQLQRDWFDVFVAAHRVILDLKGSE
ncbi:MAG: hypothetical protein ABSH22_08090 [Tepidisphaeraceae bacterium]|jgi:hypothetical protein